MTKLKGFMLYFVSINMKMSMHVNCLKITSIRRKIIEYRGTTHINACMTYIIQLYITINYMMIF